MKQPPTFEDAVLATWNNREFMENYCRLRGAKTLLAAPDSRSAIERMVDEAAGHQPYAIDKREAHEFFEFVRDYVWLPVLQRTAAE